MIIIVEELIGNDMMVMIIPNDVDGSDSDNED
jgi:hypothetical protein